MCRHTMLGRRGFPCGAIHRAPRHARPAQRAVRVISAILDLEPGGGERGTAFERKCGQRSCIAGRAEPEHMGSPSRGEGTEPVERDFERGGVPGDRRHDVQRRGCALLVDLSEEVHGQVQCFRPRPSNIRDAISEIRLQPPRRREPGLRDRNGEEAPHPAGAVAVGFGLGLAGDGLGLAAGQGFPPALISDTRI